jgi:hypothetical protein
MNLRRSSPHHRTNIALMFSFTSATVRVEDGLHGGSIEYISSPTGPLSVAIGMLHAWNNRNLLSVSRSLLVCFTIQSSMRPMPVSSLKTDRELMLSLTNLPALWFESNNRHARFTQLVSTDAKFL